MDVPGMMASAASTDSVAEDDAGLEAVGSCVAVPVPVEAPEALPPPRPGQFGPYWLPSGERFLGQSPNVYGPLLPRILRLMCSQFLLGPVPKTACVRGTRP